MKAPAPKKLWEFRIKPSRSIGTFEGSDPPVFLGDLVGLPTEGLAAFYALDARTGRLRWTFELRKTEKPEDPMLARSALVPVANGWVALCEGTSNYHVVPLVARNGPAPSRAVPHAESGEATLCAADGDAVVHLLGDKVLGTFDVEKGRWVRWTTKVPWQDAPPRRDPRGYVLGGSLITFETPRTPEGAPARIVFRDLKTGRELKTLDPQGSPHGRGVRIWKDRMLLPVSGPQGTDLLVVDPKSKSGRLVPLDPKLSRHGTTLLGDTLYWMVAPPVDPVPTPLLCSVDLKTLKPDPPRPLSLTEAGPVEAWNGELLVPAGTLMRWDPTTEALTPIFKNRGWLGVHAAGSAALRYLGMKGYDAWELPPA